ncbi:hypothetical protein ACFWP2_28375 [Kitasatospora sp. NPDC058444]|uniref:hypothetical protein n=1 Tax=Kitasatospora sp. NPDC058444 TaxID=3346504 RepID=UPI00365E7F5F
MPYEIGAKVKLTRDVQVATGGAAAGTGSPGPLSLAGGLTGIVTGSAQEAGHVSPDALASFDQQTRGVRLDAFTAGLIGDLRQRIVEAGAFGPGGGGTRYKVRFENGFVLDGLEEGLLTGA